MKLSTTYGVPSRIGVLVLFVASSKSLVAAPGGRFDHVENLGRDANSTFHEATLTVSTDGLTVYFGSDRLGGFGGDIRGTDLWVATRESPDQLFGDARNLEELNTTFDDGSPHLSADGLTLYFYSSRPGGEGGTFFGADLYAATRRSVEDPFEEITNLDTINTEFDEGTPGVSADGLTLYFASNRPGFGSLDLYRATREKVTDDEGNFVQFGNVENLGPEVNTAAEEISPSISRDGLTLFFSDLLDARLGVRGEGGTDVWMATRSNLNEPFGNVRNLFFPVNTRVNDGAPFIARDWPAAGSKLYFIRGRGGGGQGALDMWEATWVPAEDEEVVEVECPDQACFALSSDGGVMRQLIVGPIDLEGDVGPRCDNYGTFATTDYVTDGVTTERNLLVEEDEEIAPNFSEGGVGVLPTADAGINPRGAEGLLQVWSIDADRRGRISFDDRIGIADAYIVYALVYLVNPTAECREIVLEVGSDDAVKVIFNGQVVHVNPICRLLPDYERGDQIPLSLLPGKNVLLCALLEGEGSTNLRSVIRNPDGTPVTDGSVFVSLTPPLASPGTTARIRRTIDSELHGPNDIVRITLRAEGLRGPVTVEETIPPGYSFVDKAGGTTSENRITLTVSTDGEWSYTLRAPPSGDCGCATLSGQATSHSASGCFPVTGDAALTLFSEATSDTFKVSHFGDSAQVWFEAEAFEERSPSGEEFFPIVCKEGAFGCAVSPAGGPGGRISWLVDIEEAGGQAGDWFFWGRIINPFARPDYLLVEEDPADWERLPEGPPFSPPFTDREDRIFRTHAGPFWKWVRRQGEGHVKHLEDGENLMHIFHHEGDSSVLWDVFLWTNDLDYVPSDEDYERAEVRNPPPPPKVLFRRGDVDDSGTLEITDAIQNLTYQFLGSSPPPCLDALDFDDSGTIEIPDPIGILNHLFFGGAPPAPPAMECGVDPGDDELTCQSSSCGRTP